VSNSISKNNVARGANLLVHILSEPSPLGTNEHTDIDDYTFFINHALGSRCIPAARSKFSTHPPRVNESWEPIQSLFPRKGLRRHALESSCNFLLHLLDSLW